MKPQSLEVVESSGYLCFGMTAYYPMMTLAENFAEKTEGLGGGAIICGRHKTAK